MQIKDAIQILAHKNERVYDSLAKVTSVNGTTVDVELLKEGLVLFDVRLTAADAKGFLITPKVGSIVMVSYMDRVNAYVTMYSEIDLYTIQNENESLKKILSDLIGAIEQMTVTTPSGPSGTPINISSFTQIKNRLDKIFKE